MEKTVDTQPKTNTNLRWQVALAFIAFILIGANDGAVGVILPSLGQYYNISKGIVSLLFLAGSIGYLTAAFSSGLLLEKLGRRSFLMLGASVFLVGAAVNSFKPPFVVLLVSLLIIGFGVAIIDAGLNAYIASLPNSTSTLNYLHAFYGMGALIGPVIATTLVIVWSLGWNSVYWLWIAYGALILIGIAVMYHSSHSADSGADKSQETGNVMVAALRLRVVWLAAFFLLFYVGTEVSMGNWSFSYLTEYRHRPDVLSGWTVSGYWLGLTLGRLILPRFAKRYGNRRLIQGCLVGVAAGLLLVWFGQVEAIEIFGLLLTGFSLGPIFPTTIAIMPELIPQRILQSAIGFMASLGAMGAAFFPWIAGNLAQLIGLWTLLPYAIVLTIAMFGIWLALQNKRSAEIAKLSNEQ